MDRLHRLVTALLGTHNPRWRTSPIPYGETDWVATALLRASSVDRDFVVHTSHTGLNDDEREALLGWVAWIRELHHSYFLRLKLEPPAMPTWNHPTLGAASVAELTRWARVTRRSRWPLLRNVVAESLRCLVELDLLDQLPLPTKHEDLFELMCLVRILKHLGSTDATVRWLDVESGNEVRTSDLSARYQHDLDPHATLRAGLYPPEVIAAMDAHGVNPPRRTDLLITFTTPRAGFAGILVECKSGEQDPESTIYQLLAYRSSLRTEISGPVLVWGLIELAMAPAFPATPDGGDRWLFSSADHIPSVLATLGLAVQ